MKKNKNSKSTENEIDWEHLTKEEFDELQMKTCVEEHERKMEERYKKYKYNDAKFYEPMPLEEF